MSCAWRSKASVTSKTASLPSRDRGGFMSATQSRNLDEIARKATLAPAKLAHVVIRCISPARLRDWYLNVLQGHVSYENEMVCFLTYDDEHHRIGLVQIPGLQQDAPPGPGLEHIAFTYPDLGTLLANYRRLKKQGI